MLEWWNALDPVGQVFAAVAIPATAVMLIQSLLLLIGIGGGHDGDFSGGHDGDFSGGHDIGFDASHDVGFDASHDIGFDSDTAASHGGGHGDDGLSLFTLRGIVAFLSIGGWAGLACITSEKGTLIAAIVSLAAGSAALFAVALIFKLVYKMQDSGNLDLKNAVGKTGKVYIPIPAGTEGQGKINLILQESYIELDAVTRADRTLNTGELVTVDEIIEQNIMVVSPAEQNNNSEKEGISRWIR